MLAALVLAAALADTPPAPASGGAVEGVVVTATKPVVGDLQKGVVDYRPEFFVPVRPSSAMDMVNWLPGFVYEDTRDMRGLEGATGNVLIDGKPPTSKTDTLTNVLKRIPADQVERVDLILGGAPGIDMHGRNVIANVILKVRDKPLKTVTVASYIDTHGRAAPDLLITRSDKSGGRNLEGSIEIQRNIAVFPTFGYGPWVRKDGTGATEFTADERFQYDGPYATANGSYEFPLAGGRFRVSSLAKLTHETLDEEDHLTSGPGAYSFRHTGDYGQGELGLHYERAFRALNLEVQALERYRRQTAEDAIDRPPAPSGNTVDAHLMESVQRAVLRYKTGDTLTLESSAEHALNDSYSRTAATQDGQPIVVPVANVDLTEDRWEGGTSAAWKPNGKFSFDAAVKVETFRLKATGDLTVDRQQTYVKPRLALAWSPDKDSQLRLRGEYEVQQIPLNAIITYNEYESGQLRNGNADIRPNRAWVAEAVFERHFWSAGDLTVTARYKAHQDLLDDIAMFTASGQGYEILSNIGSGRESDLIGNLMIPLKRFGFGASTLRAVLTWQKVRATDPVSGDQRNLSQFPELKEELHFAQDLGWWKLNWGFNLLYQSGTVLYRPFGNEDLDGWPALGVYVERRLPGDMTLRLEAPNTPLTAAKNTISVFQGLRDKSALLYVDDKRLAVGPIVYVKLRKSF
jgi:hypothetical protein